MTSKALLLTGCLLCAVALVGCADSRSVLLGGFPPGHTIGDATARRVVRGVRRHWLSEIARLGHQNPYRHFNNISAAEFRERLAAEASRYGFTVKRLQFLRPRQVAPLVVVQTTHYVDVANAFPLIEESLDPARHNGNGRWRFEAIYLEAQDERGVPFLVIWNALRGPYLDGGHWARAKAVEPPFAHG